VARGDLRNQRSQRIPQTRWRSVDDRHRADLVGWRAIQDARRHVEHVE